MSEPKSTLPGLSQVESEPVAVIGIGCRLPGGVHDPVALWQLLCGGVDAISEVPEDRWNLPSFHDASDPPGLGKSTSRWGGFIEGIDRFDADFFEISPREAREMDPQQRLLLEVTWEAIEDAGLRTDQLKGSSTGVFVGASNQDYSQIQHTVPDLTTVDAHSVSGKAACMLSNRLSYFFDLLGPSQTIDTACSSSLVALHSACQSLAGKESSLALVAGINLLISPSTFVGCTRASMLSPDGRCKAFDASANGFVRSEGVAVLVLKPLAVADRDRIYSLIRSTAVNQDGHSSSLMMPRLSSQEALFRDCCRRAAVAPDQVHYVEAHGTGTAVGDPIEANAIGRVFGAGRTNGERVRVGSVKTNLGHLEPAAGATGLIKTALVLKHGLVPPNLHFREANPDIRFDELNLTVPTRSEPWPDHQDRRLAAVCSYGIGGTNAAAILEAPPRTTAQPKQGSRESGESVAKPLLVPLSAHSSGALQSLAAAYGGLLSDSPKPSLEDLAWTAATRRTHHPERLAVVVGSLQELAETLDAFSRGEKVGAAVGRANSELGDEPVFVFSGQGPQWWGMGRELLTSASIFRDCAERIDSLFRKVAGWSIRRELLREKSSSRMKRTSVAQPALFCLQVSLAAQLRVWGIEPGKVVGHSVGEVAAASVSGALSLEDAVQVIFQRSRCMELAEAAGKMLAVGCSETEAEELLKSEEWGEVSLAAVNSPTSTTLSGKGDVIESLARELKRRHLFCRFLPLEYSFHSPMMEPVRDLLRGSLTNLRPQPCTIPMVSTVLGRKVDGTELDADYWWRNVREPVRFGDAIGELLLQRESVYVELGPEPVLASSILDCAAQGRRAVTVVPTLEPSVPDRQAALSSLGQLYTLGFPVRWEKLLPTGKLTRLPTYPWQGESFWAEPEEGRQHRLAPLHQFLGRPQPGPEPSWTLSLGREDLEGLFSDHRVRGEVILPAALFLESFVSAANQVLETSDLIVERFRVSSPCFLSDEGPTSIRTTLRTENSELTLHTRGPGQTSWTARCFARTRRLESRDQALTENLDRLRNRCPVEIAPAEGYANLKDIGLDHGPAFRGVEKVWSGSEEALGRISAPQEISSTLGECWLHPVLTDCCSQTLVFHVARKATHSRLFLPVSIQEVRVHQRLDEAFWCHTTIRARGRVSIVADFRLYDDSGQLLGALSEVRFQEADKGGFRPSAEHILQQEWLLDPALPGVPLRGDRLQALDSAVATAATQASAVGLDVQQADFRQDAQNRLIPLLARLLRGAWPDGPPLRDPEMEEGEEPAASFPGGVLEHCLTVLDETGWLDRAGQRWLQPRDSVAPELLPGVIGTLLADHPDQAAVLRIFCRILDYLRLTLGGETVDWSLTGTLRDDVEELTEGSSDSRLSGFLLDALINTQRAYQDSIPVRILLLGAGTAISARPILYKTTPEMTCTVADPAADIVTVLKERWQSLSSVNFLELDGEYCPIDQGLPPNFFSVVIVADIALADRNEKTAGQIGNLLVPGGDLIVLGRSAETPFQKFLFGMLQLLDTPDRSRPPLPSPPGVDLLKRFEGPGWARAATGSVGDLRLTCLTRTEGTGLGQDVIARLPDQPADSWLILADDGGVGQSIVKQLEQLGQECLVVENAGAFWAPDGGDSPESPVYSHVRDLLEHRDRPHGDLRGVIYLWGRNSPTLSQGLDLPVDQMLDASMRLAELVTALDDLQLVPPPRLWVVTRGAHASNGTTPDVVQSPLWGFGRVLTREYPRFRPSRVDLSDQPSQLEIASLCRDLCESGEEDETLLRGSLRWVSRYQRCRPKGNHSSHEQTPFKLTIPEPGSLDRLVLAGAPRVAPGPGQLEIETTATGINFADLMKILGIYPGLQDGPVALGEECAGTIVRLGPEVDWLKVGDRVVAAPPFAAGNFVTTSATLAWKVPDGIHLEAAAAIPIAFLTAHYALNHVGRLQDGERVLIHSASGGVGMAAIQLARQKRAEIFATAGTPEKRHFLQLLGLSEVMDSRTLTFADEIMERTAGEGIDLVLNSLAGDAIDLGLSVLRENGRFLEIGKRDIYLDRPVRLRPFRKQLAFTSIDMNAILRQQPDLIRELSAEILEGFGTGDLRPIPYRVFPVAEAPAALKSMARARHIGKLVLSTVEAPPPSTSLATPLRFREDGTYLVTGGLGGFGLEAASWIVDQGGGHLVLLGRNPPSSESASRIAKLEGRGAQVAVEYADVADAEDLTRVLRRVEKSAPPLRGVFHAAAVFDDSITRNLSRDRLLKVWKPKLQGAWNLHCQTTHCPLDYFVVFSSLAAFIGHAGQAAYASANAFLDGLASFRRQQRQAATSVAWGVIKEVGYASRNPEALSGMESMGVLGINPRRALTMLGKSLRENAVHAAVFKMDWQRWDASGASWVPNRVKRLVPAHASGGQEARSSDFLSRISSTPVEERQFLFEDLLLETLGRLLGKNSEKLDRSKPVTELGMDSLMGLELRNWVETELVLSLPTVELLKGPSLTQIATFLVKQRSSDDGKTTTSESPPQLPMVPPGARQPIRESRAMATAMNNRGQIVGDEAPRRGVRNRRSRLRSLSEYALARGMCSLIGSLPPQVAETVASRLLPPLASGLLTRHRRRAFHNLELAFGPGDHRPTLRKMYGHLGKMFLDFLIRSRSAGGGYSIEVAPESDSIGEELKRLESPYIFVSGHLGHWEVLAADASHLGFPCHCVARRLDNPHLEE